MKVKPSELATILGLSRPRVSQLTADGIFEVGTDGKHDLGKSVRGYIAHLEVGALNPEIAAHRAKLIAEQTRRLKIANDRQEGQLMLLDDVKQIVLAANNVVTQALDAMPGRLANALAAESNPAKIYDRIKIEVRNARHMIADKFEEFAAAEQASAEAEPG